MILLLSFLSEHDFHVEVDEVYTLNEKGVKKDRVIISITWFNSE